MIDVQPAGFDLLTAEQQKLFESVHAKHMGVLGSQARAKLGDVKAVTWNSEGNCLNVYFKDVWYHYDQDGNWY